MELVTDGTCEKYKMVKQFETMILINKQRRKRVRLSNEPTVHIMTDGTCAKYKMVKQFDTMNIRVYQLQMT